MTAASPRGRSYACLGRLREAFPHQSALLPCNRETRAGTTHAVLLLLTPRAQTRPFSTQSDCPRPGDFAGTQADAATSLQPGEGLSPALRTLCPVHSSRVTAVFAVTAPGRVKPTGKPKAWVYF